MSDSETGRIAWIDYAKGFCIVAVVAFYASTYVEGLAHEEGWMSYWVEFARPFRMPTFFLLCGLLLSRTIARPWRDYLDKKVVHFLYFFSLWTTIYFAAGVLNGEFDGGPPLWLDYLWWYAEPFHMLWFIQMLPVYFLVTRLVRPVPAVIVLAIAGLLQVWGPETEWRQFDRFSERFVYFYAGYLFAPLCFRLAGWARANVALALAALASWATINALVVLAECADAPLISLTLGMTGAGAMVAAASLLTRVPRMHWLRYLGENSIVIFLSFFLALVISARILDKLDLVANVGLLTLLVTALSVALPILGYRLVRATPLAFLYIRPRWAKCSAETRGKSAPTVVDVAADSRSPARASVLSIKPIGPAQVGK